MKNAVKIFIFLLFPIFANSQQHYTDSLKHALSSAKTDSARFSTLGDLTYYYAQADLKKGISYADLRIAIARRNNKPLDVSSSLLMKGFLMMLSSKYIESLQHLEQALKIAEDPKNENGGWYRGNYFNPAKNRIDIIANIHLSWGELMDATGNIPESINQFKQTIKFAQDAGDPGLVAWGQQGLAGCYYDSLGKTDSALMYEKKALPVIERDSKQLFGSIGIKKYISETDLLTANLYLLKHNYQLALYYLHKGIYDGITQIDPTHLSYCYDGLATFYLQRKVVDSALYYSKKELAALKNTPQNDLSAGYNNLYRSYRLKGLKDSTLKYEDLAIAAKDSVNSANQQNLSDFQNQLFKEQLRLRDLEKERISAEDRNKTIAFVSGIAIIIFLAFVFYRNAKRTKAANQLLSQQKEEIEDALSQLKSTQTQLVQREKMASLGELTAGIAHEIQNPLNFVNNFSDVNREMLEELKEELAAGNTDEVKAIAEDILRNEEKINHHGKRADAIVKGMLQHSRTSSGEKQPTDINMLAEEFLKLSYQGLRAKDKSFNAEIVTKLDKNIAKANIVQQDVGRVLLNIFNNAFYAVNQKQKTAGKDYKPIVTLTTSAGKGNVMIKIEDNGTGIPEAIKEKIMQPFFTTKPTGEGTGLGLSISYDIVVKAHGGQIKVESAEGKGSEFTIIL